MYMSQEARVIRSSELDIDDPQLSLAQVLEHAEHVRMAMSYWQKQNNNRKAPQHKDSPSKELAELINTNAQKIAHKVKVAIHLNSREVASMDSCTLTSGGHQYK
ncbi:uncharacterized protein PGTG_16430 [Puccinia graminis f. sp. tritici CRL 75-36-700-3]|uniref:Uncharacterized protein n=1 Tax=Puccinia graminis f. sp. tritici (strain CRL 75-36-700-3 / race SCCL) TaxID=418459 RepID=E3L3W4_PUCGT|nr:uncharacterized protein PGTG_16430 [Puccinia graminis f. sp. tritici CRL 75-36-700-3]EFP91239.1 hypothetical protein PGTG_16430 [Puccinia graminis f. sp. tritici CRL 75-36-700-3]